MEQSRKLRFAHGKQGNNSKCVSKQEEDFGIAHFDSNPFQLEFYVDDLGPVARSMVSANRVKYHDTL